MRKKSQKVREEESRIAKGKIREESRIEKGKIREESRIEKGKIREKSRAEREKVREESRAEREKIREEKSRIEKEKIREEESRTGKEKIREKSRAEREKIREESRIEKEKVQKEEKKQQTDRIEDSKKKKSVSTSNFTYIVRCSDGTFYTGWTTHLEERIRVHNEGKGAKYTRSRRPVELVYWEIFETKQEAMSREAAIKRLSRREKEKLIEITETE